MILPGLDLLGLDLPCPVDPVRLTGQQDAQERRQPGEYF